MKMLMTAAVLMVASSAHAATLEFSVRDSEKFSDLRTTNGNEAGFRKEVLASLEAQFRNEASRLPENEVLKVELTDLNLAGEIEYFIPGYPFGVRVVRNLDVPGMELSYQLLSADQKVLKSGGDKFSDLGFRSGLGTWRMNQSLDYEKRMISKWYRETLQ